MKPTDKIKSFFYRPIPLHKKVDKIFNIRIPRPISIILIILFGIPVFLTILDYTISIFYSVCFRSYMFISYQLDYGYPISWAGFWVLPAITLLAILIHHIFSKTKSVSRLIRWAIVLVFIEIVTYIWLNAWGWANTITTQNDFKTYVLPIEDRLEIILKYTKALFQTVALSMVLIVGRMFLTKQK